MAPDTNVLLARELNKLRKDELIEILINQKLPTTITSDVLQKFVKQLSVNKFNHSQNFYDEFQDSQQGVMCERKLCIKIQSEIDVLRRLTYQLEKRASEQEDLICLLKQSGIYNNDSKSFNVEPSTNKTDNKMTCVEENNTQQKPIPEVKIDNSQKLAYSTVVRNKSPKKRTHDDNKLASQTKKNIQQKTVVNKTNRFKPIIGNGKNSTTIIKTVPKMGYLHVYRCDPSVTCKDLSTVLQETAPSINFVCEEWNKTERGSSFKVSFPIEHCEEVYNADMWPAGAAVRRFTFHKKKSNFQETIKTQDDK